MKPAIRVENLGKCYRVAHQQQRAGYRTLRDSLVDAIKGPFRRWFKGEGAAAEDFWALKDVSFEVKPGEVVGIIGRNGAGKSTLLKVLSRITKPTTGRVELNGRVGSLLEVGTGFHPELTGRENIYLNGSILGMRREEITRKFDEIVAFAEVEQFLDTPVKRYSSGMYVRLAFAVAAYLEPELLIVDEVLAVGDMAFQKKCLDKMRQLASSGLTILFVSHQMGAVQSLCSHAVHLERGSVRNFGPKHRIVAEYIDSGSTMSPACEWIELDTEFRTLKGRAWFTGMRFGNDVPESANRLYPTGPADFDVSIFARDEINPVYIAISLYDRNDTCLISANSGRSRVPIRLSRGRNVFRFRIDDLNLIPGNYRVELWMADGRIVLDKVQSAATATVTEYIPYDPTKILSLDGSVTASFTINALLSGH
jgi:lipopolysaccharide transport system ATP-binding protein